MSQKVKTSLDFLNEGKIINLPDGINPQDAATVAQLGAGDDILSGGKVTWSGVGLTFDVTAGTYKINGIYHTSPGGSITLDASNTTYDRLDVIGFDDTGALFKITGTPSANPEIPQVDASSQIYLTAILVNANATVPANVSQQIIYNENVEWAGLAVNMTANLNNTVNPFTGSKAIDVTAASNGGYLQFVNTGAINITNFNFLKLYIRLKAALANNSNINITFFNGSTQVSNTVTLGTAYGFVKGTINTYQNITVNTSAFTFTNSAFDRVRVTFAGSGFSAFYLDYLQLQAGVTSNQAINWGSISGLLTNQTDLQAALNSKENFIAAGTTSQFWRGDKTWQTIPPLTWGGIGGTLSAQTDLQTALNAKVDKITGKGLSTEDYTTTEKTKLSGIAAGAQVNTLDDIFPGTNISIDKTDPLNPIINALTGGGTGKYLISGGAVWSGAGLVYDVSALSYFFNGNKTAAATSETLAASDPTDNRLDAVVVDETGAVSVITGTPSASPITPAIPVDQLLIQYILVEAASTVPAVTQENIYLDNAEWTAVNYTTGGTMVGTTNFNATDSPKQGTKCIDNSLDGRTGIRFYKGTPIDLSTFATLSLWVRFSATVASGEKLYARFENTSLVPTGNQVNLFSYGLQKNIVNTWQLAVIPVSLFGALTNVQGLRMILTGGTNGVQIEWDVDFITLTDGSTPVITTPTISFYKDSVKIADQKGLDIVEGTGMSITAVEDAVAGTVKYKFTPDTNKAYVDAADALKLNIADYNQHFVGKYTTLAALQAAYPTANAGDYGQVDAGAGHDVANYNYDIEDGWILGGTGSGATTTDALPEGSTNLYFTTARAIAAVDISGKVDKITGKGLSTEDYTTTEKTKLSGIAAGAQVNDPNTVISTAGKLPALDGSLLTNLPSSGGGGTFYGTASGTNTYAATITGIAAYTAGMTVEMKFTNGCTGPSTGNINSLGALSIVKNGSAATVAGDIPAGAVLTLVYDGTNLQIVGGGGGGTTKATASELNIGTDDDKFATALALEGSKYLNQGGSKLSATASGTNTYTVAISPAITAYSATQRFFIKFTNANTGASTLNLNSLGAITMMKGANSNLAAGDIQAGQIFCVAYDGTNFQLLGSASIIPQNASKVVTTNTSGLPVADYDLIDYLSTTTEATLLAQNWSGGSVTATGLAGQKVFGATYEFTCTGTNTWRRTPYNLIWNDLYLANVSDSGGVKTSTQMATLYPSAVQGQRARGANGVYEYFGLFGWVYFPFTII